MFAVRQITESIGRLLNSDSVLDDSAIHENGKAVSHFALQSLPIKLAQRVAQILQKGSLTDRQTGLSELAAAWLDAYGALPLVAIKVFIRSLPDDPDGRALKTRISEMLPEASPEERLSIAMLLAEARLPLPALSLLNTLYAENPLLKDEFCRLAWLAYGRDGLAQPFVETAMRDLSENRISPEWKGRLAAAFVRTSASEDARSLLEDACRETALSPAVAGEFLRGLIHWLGPCLCDEILHDVLRFAVRQYTDRGMPSPADRLLCARALMGLREPDAAAACCPDPSATDGCTLTSFFALHGFPSHAAGAFAGIPSTLKAKPSGNAFALHLALASALAGETGICCEALHFLHENRLPTLLQPAAVPTERTWFWLAVCYASLGLNSQARQYLDYWCPPERRKNSPWAAVFERMPERACQSALSVPSFLL